MMKNNDYFLRLNGRHSVKISNNGTVFYSIGKQKLFILKKDALQEIKELLNLRTASSTDSDNGNVIRIKSNGKTISIYNLELYTKLVRFIFDEANIKSPKDNYRAITNEIEHYMIYGENEGDTAYEIEHNLLNVFIPIFENGNSMEFVALINLFLTKASKLYHAEEGFIYLDSI